MTCSLSATVGRPTPGIVAVNGCTIPRDAIAREVQYHPAAKPIEAWQAAARALVIRQLLLQEARALGIVATPMADAAGRRETEEEALIRAVVEQEVKTPSPDVATCRRYYEQNRRRFRSPALYEAAHILFAARRDDVDGFARAERDATSVLAELKLRPDRFADLAKVYSACPSAAQGGNLGQISAGQTTPEFEQALFALAPGAITDRPVETRYGLHIIRLERRIDERQLPFEAVAGRIAAYLSESVTRRASAQYIARLASAATITGVTLEGADAHRVN